MKGMGKESVKIGMMEIDLEKTSTEKYLWLPAQAV